MSIEDFKNYLLDQKFIKILNNQQYYEDIILKAKNLRTKYNKFVVVALGGSFMAAKSILDIVYDAKDIHFIFYADKSSVDNILNQCDDDTLFIFISKSGNTIETLAIFEYIRVKQFKNFTFITNFHANNNLLKLIKDENYDIMIHEDISGRYSFTTNVLMLVLAIARIDINQVLCGFRDAVEKYQIDQKFTDEILNGKINNNIIMSYDTRFRTFNEWYLQLFAESLCTLDIFDVIPISNIGTMDQHSVMEGYLANPKNKFINFVKVAHEDNVKFNISSIIGEDKYISLTNIKEQELFATQKTCNDLGLKTRVLDIKSEPYSLAFNMLSLTIEILYIAYKLNINPFIQDMVEIRKKNGINMLRSLR